MGVSDPQGLLNMEFLPPEEKYEQLARIFYQKGKPELRGNLPVRLLDSLLLRSMGLILGFGKKCPDAEDEYRRLTDNFKRLGKMAKPLGHLGAPGRWILGVTFGAYGNLVVRQGISNVEPQTDYIEASREYFKVADLYNFGMEICGKDGDRIAFKVAECPVGYVSGDDVGVCMATMEFDNKCIKGLGGQSIIKEVIPEGAPACLIHIVPVGSDTPQD
jgi:hypothetical protein